MHHTGREINQLKEVLKKAEEPLTAQEIQSITEEYESASADFGSSHRIATILGRLESRTNIEVIRDRPYKYRLDE